MSQAFRTSLFAAALVAGSLLNAVAAEAQPPQAVPADIPCPQQGCNHGPAFVVHLSSSADVRLDNGILHYAMSDVLQNTGGRNAEVDYYTPLPPLAAFQNLTMSINGEMIAGEFLAAKRARAIYDAIVRTNRDPALVEWANSQMLRTRIFPIFPAEKKIVDVRMQSATRRENETIRVDYMSGTKRGDASPAGGTPVSIRFTYPDSAHYGIPFSNTHTLTTISRENGRRTVTATGTASDITIFLPASAEVEPFINVMAYATPDQNGYALLSITPPPLSPLSLPRDIVIALDASKSMTGARIGMARAAIERLLAALAPEDRFRIIAFSDSVGSGSSALLPPTLRNLERARTYLASQVTNGGTNTAAALDMAFSTFRRGDLTRQQFVLLVTDGAPTSGELRYDEIIRGVAETRGRARVATLGIDAQLNEEFLRDIALHGEGIARTIVPGQSSEPFVRELLAATAPVITDARITAQGVQLTEMDLRGTQNMYPGKEIVIPARYSGSGSATITVEGTTAGGPLRWSRTVHLPAADTRNSFVPRIWAARKIAYLEHLRQARCEDRGLEKQITDLAEKHGVISPFTSYLVLEPGIQVDKDGRVTNARDFVAGAAPQGAGRGDGIGARQIGPGSDVVIQIRNPLNIQGFTQPLLIIDGVIQMQDVGATSRTPIQNTGNVVINPLDLDAKSIENIEIIRGAAAAALYGQRAVNGVINITTKREKGTLEKSVVPRSVCPV